MFQLPVPPKKKKEKRLVQYPSALVLPLFFLPFPPITVIVCLYPLNLQSYYYLFEKRLDDEEIYIYETGNMFLDASSIYFVSCGREGFFVVYIPMYVCVFAVH